MPLALPYPAPHEEEDLVLDDDELNPDLLHSSSSSSSSSSASSILHAPTQTHPPTPSSFSHNSMKLMRDHEWRLMVRAHFRRSLDGTPTDPLWAPFSWTYVMQAGR